MCLGPGFNSGSEKMAVSSSTDLLKNSQFDQEAGPQSMWNDAGTEAFPIEAKTANLLGPEKRGRVSVQLPPGTCEFGDTALQFEKNRPSRNDSAIQPELQADVADPSRNGGSRTLYVPANFPGPDEHPAAQVDALLAAGPSHLLQVNGAGWTVIDKSGTVLHSSSYADWFARFIGPEDEVFLHSPKVFYDQHSGRWLMVIGAWSRDPGDAKIRSWVFVSASQTRNPTGKWWQWRLDAGLNGLQLTSYYATSLSIGLDSGSLYLSMNMSDQTGSFRYCKVRAIEKEPLLKGEPSKWLDFWGMQNADGSPAFGLLPANTYGTPGIEYFISAVSNGGEINIWNLAVQQSGPVLQRRTVATAPYSAAPDALQGNGKPAVDTGDTRFLSAVFRNGLLWAVHTVAADWGDEVRAGIEWFIINPGAGRIVQHRVYGQPGADYFSPALMADGKGNISLIFNSLREGGQVSLRLTGRLGIETPNKLQPSILLLEGMAAAPAEWCGSNGAAVDPNDIKIWLSGKYPRTTTRGGSWIIETSFMLNQPEMKRR